MNHRRQVLVTVGAALAGRHALLRAQPAAVPIKRVGMLTAGSRDEAQRVLGPRFDEMTRLGWVEGRNLNYDWSSADSVPALLPRRASELAARQPDVIFAGFVSTALAARLTTSTIAIVFGGVSYPVELDWSAACRVRAAT